MKFDIDSYREILDTITRNKSRSFLTGFGVFWGVFMLIVLIGGGQGLKEMLQSNFAGFATNTAMIWTLNTTKPYKGFRKGRYVSMVENDMTRLRQQVPELDIITPYMFGGNKKAVVGEYSFDATVAGVDHDYARVAPPVMYYGRYINEMDVRQARKVCVIGKEVYKKLFPGGGDPCGRRIRVDAAYYTVVGVDYKVNGINISGRPDQLVTIPYTLFRKTYNTGDQIHSLAVTGKPGVVMSTLTDRIRTVIARAHMIDPTDEKAITTFNTEVLFAMLDNLFNGVNFLMARGHRHAAGRCYRCVQHHDGDGQGAHHRDWHPPCHRRHTEDDSLADHVGEHRPDCRGGHEWHPLRRGCASTHRTGKHRRRYPCRPFPSGLLDGYHRHPAAQSAGRTGRTRSRMACHEHQTR